VYLNSYTIFFIVEIAMPNSIAYAHTGKDHRNPLMVVSFTFAEGISFLAGGIVAPSTEEGRLYAF
jgi:hypothetical protein